MEIPVNEVSERSYEPILLQDLDEIHIGSKERLKKYFLIWQRAEMVRCPMT